MDFIWIWSDYFNGKEEKAIWFNMGLDSSSQQGKNGVNFEIDLRLERLIWLWILYRSQSWQQFLWLLWIRVELINMERRNICGDLVKEIEVQRVCCILWLFTEKMAQILINKNKGNIVGSVTSPALGRDSGMISAQAAAARDSSKVIRTETVKVGSLDVSKRIKQFSLTIIGRAWNPMAQNMEDLLRLFPKILKMEGKVIGSDLGMGKFQLNFQEIKDIEEVLQNEPYHFDSWMVSMVKWEPVVSSLYPSTLTFWVQVVDIPFHYWAEETIRMVGNVLGNVKEVDEESGSVRVTINGFEPLIFKTIIPFDNGDEIEVSLIYDKLVGFCNHCFRISHGREFCPDLAVNNERRKVDLGVVSTQQGGSSRGDRQWSASLKRPMDTSNAENRVRIPYKKEFNDRDRFQQKRGVGQDHGNWENKRGKRESSHDYGRDSRMKQGMVLPRSKVQGSTWPLPLYRAKEDHSSVQKEHVANLGKHDGVTAPVQLIANMSETITDWSAILSDPLDASVTLEDGGGLLEEGELSKTPFTLQEIEAMTNEMMKEDEADAKEQSDSGAIPGGVKVASGAMVNAGMVALPEPPGCP